MPSIRVLTTFVLSRFASAFHRHAPRQHPGQPLHGYLSDEGTIGGIHHVTPYAIEFNTKVNREGSKFVQLVDMTGVTSSRGEINEGRIGQESAREWRI